LDEGNVRGVSGDSDILRLRKVDESSLGEVGVDLDLEDGGFDASVAEEIDDESTLEVGDTDRLGKTKVDKVLHSLPGLLNGGLALNDLSIEGVPPGRVAILGVDILESYGEVDVEDIKVAETKRWALPSERRQNSYSLDSPPFELLTGNGLNALLLVEGVPELGDDDQVLTLDETLGDCALDALTSTLLISVVYIPG
jgi:hypothetical protein